MGLLVRLSIIIDVLRHNHVQLAGLVEGALVGGSPLFNLSVSSSANPAAHIIAKLLVHFSTLGSLD